LIFASAVEAGTAAVAANSGRIENMLTINVESTSEVVVLRCSGRIVCGHETALLCSAMQQESRNVVVDLTEVDAVDAAGVGALLSLQAAGVYLKLLNPSPQVREILKVTRLNSIFEICASQSIAETTQEGRSDNPSERFTFASSPNA
jgi:anti-anti-sigma factor